MTPPWNRPFCCNSSGRRSTSSVQLPRASSDRLGADMRHETLTADAVADARRDRGKLGISVRRHFFSPLISGVTSARMAQAISVSACARGSDWSRPDSQARQNTCAGPTIWLKNSVALIGNNSPRAISGAAPAFDGLGQPRVLAALGGADFLAPFGARNLEQEARLAAVVDDPVEMGADHPRDALARAGLRIERRHHARVVALQDFQEQRAGEFLLRAEEMEKAAVGSARADCGLRPPSRLRIRRDRTR